MNAAKAEHGGYCSGKIIPASNVTIFDPNAAKPAVLPTVETKPAKSDQRVRLIKDGDVVTAIEVHCKCGEVIRLDCEY